ncbi:hypothetical protein M407DRAFT_22734 [Tulasnella calospora MUT 4182]|uniref:Uncharacterized protein n=1 Tax=Tulasnella calospora MUT 4182 TaxID=1051891 RepID=A0A0C3L2Y8_9AGAM|nr:hypothetical protein M407DRAFT_22734 [Tulasnella calospora MUT 4182]
MATSTEDIRRPSASSAQYYDPPSGIQRRAGHTRNQSSMFSFGGAPTIASGISQTVPLIAHGAPHTRDTTYATLVPQPTDEEYRKAYTYPNETLKPHFTRKHGTSVLCQKAVHN